MCYPRPAVARFTTVSCLHLNGRGGAILGDIRQQGLYLLTGAPIPAKTSRLIELGGPPSKGWIAQMEEHWYGNEEISGSSPGPVKFSLPFFFKLEYYYYWHLLSRKTMVCALDYDLQSASLGKYCTDDMYKIRRP